ncbi:hypothetical protein KIPB_002178 [Kipferlia bialata]|uniref:RCC1-like domain-containing protein n=1 Tax=Kipferlia bialata TaxID=797122 RepID=A0A9K3CSB2_9EUKA|nr:hypothetical protein KIPB_002178 [Kipferlia bialata]|eukprot:g2178.t1
MACGGEQHSVVLTEEGLVYAMGRNEWGQLGPERHKIRDTPTLISPEGFMGRKVISIACGKDHTLVVDDTHTVWGFGSNNLHALGEDVNEYTTTVHPWVIETPTPIDIDVPIVDASCNERHCLIITDTGSLYAFGDNDAGELGTGDFETRATSPVLVTPTWDTDTPVSVSAGQDHSVVLMESGAVYAFGNNDYGQCGNTTADMELGFAILTPVLVDTSVLGGKATQVSAGGAFTLVLDTTHTVYGTGYAEHGQTGEADTLYHNTLSPIPMDTVQASTGVVQSIETGPEGSFLIMGSTPLHPPDRRVLTWICLQRCEDEVDYRDALAQLASSEWSHIISDVSFEAYDLGANSTLVWNGFTDVYPTLKRMGYTSWPMITCRDPARLRQLFSDPEPFISHALQTARINGYPGYNVDFEPADMQDQDGIDFASFLAMFSQALHEAELELQVDVFHWDPEFINPDLIAQTDVDRHVYVSLYMRIIITMDTYCGHFDPTFIDDMDKNIGWYGTDRLGIGLETVDPNTLLPFTYSEMKQRFDLITQDGIREIDGWQCPIPDNWRQLILGVLDNVSATVSEGAEATREAFRHTGFPQATEEVAKGLQRGVDALGRSKAVTETKMWMQENEGVQKASKGLRSACLHVGVFVNRLAKESKAKAGSLPPELVSGAAEEQVNVGVSGLDGDVFEVGQTSSVVHTVDYTMPPEDHPQGEVGEAEGASVAVVGGEEEGEGGREREERETQEGEAEVA